MATSKLFPKYCTVTGYPRRNDGATSADHSNYCLLCPVGY